MKVFIIVLAMFLSTCSQITEVQAQDVQSSLGTEAFDHSHSAWTEFLGKYVAGGNVDYKGIKATGEGSLDAYLARLQFVTKSQYQGWTKKQKMAFGINAYNAYTIRLVLNHYPVESMQKIGAKPGDAWKEKFIPLEKIWRSKISLGYLENEILRTNFKDSRIHFALVCASISCPALRTEAFREKGLYKQLDAQTVQFLKDSTKNRFDSSSNTLYISKIFEWYKADFTAEAPSVAAYVAKYLKGDVGAAVAAGGVKVEYLSYNWSLNGK